MTAVTVGFSRANRANCSRAGPRWLDKDASRYPPSSDATATPAAAPRYSAPMRPCRTRRSIFRIGTIRESRGQCPGSNRNRQRTNSLLRKFESNGHSTLLYRCHSSFLLSLSRIPSKPATVSQTCLFVINGLGLGNSTRCHAVIEHLANAGCRIHVLTSGNGLTYFQNTDCIETLTAMESWYYSGTHGGISGWSTPKSLGCLAQLAQAKQNRL